MAWQASSSSAQVVGTSMPTSSRMSVLTYSARAEARSGTAQQVPSTTDCSMKEGKKSLNSSSGQ